MPFLNGEEDKYRRFTFFHISNFHIIKFQVKIFSCVHILKHVRKYVSSNIRM